MNKKELIENIILRYLTGDSSEDEMRQLEEWLDESKSNRNEFLSIKKAFIETSAYLSKKEDFSKLAFENFIQKIEETPTKKHNIEYNETKPTSFKVLKYAAVILLLISVGFGGYYLGNRPEPSDAYSEIIVPYGSKTNVILPDGTKLWLNAGSKLKYNRVFNKNLREVFIEGEAYFEVKKDKIPFIVHTSHFDIRVLGTSFNVKSYADEKHIETTLVEGSILVETSKDSKPLILKPKQKLVFNKERKISKIDSINGQVNDTHDSDYQNNKRTSERNKLKELPPLKVGIIENNVDIEKAISWKEGTLIFDRESLGDLAIKLERKFDIKIDFEKEGIRAYSFTGTIGDIPLEQVLEALKLTSKVNYKIKGKAVKLY